MYHRQYYMDQINERAVLRMYRKLRIVKFYKNGEAVSGVFNYLNPLSYVAIPLLLLLATFMQGWKRTIENLDDLGLKLDAYWKERKDLIEWL